MGKGYFISFEGLDGAGKTTQIELMVQWLEKEQREYIRTREPGGTLLGNRIRDLLFNQPELEITPLAEAFLFQADRAQHFTELVLPALEMGKVVVSDRCFDSSIAYQGAARGVGVDLVAQLSQVATQGRVPDLTIMLDLDPASVYERTDHHVNSDREEQTRFDRETLFFHQRLRQAFLEQAKTNPQRIAVVDAAQPLSVVHNEIITLLKRLLSS